MKLFDSLFLFMKFKVKERFEKENLQYDLKSFANFQTFLETQLVFRAIAYNKSYKV